MLPIVVFLLCQGAMVRQIQGNPYQAQFECLRTETQPNRRSPTRISVGIVARDSQGREVEEERFYGAAGEEGGWVARIYDPLKFSNSIVERRTNKLLSRASGEAYLTVGVGKMRVALPMASLPEMGDDIGDRTIEGLVCLGRRYTTPGGKIDYWFSEELQALVQLHISDHDTETTFRVYDIRRVEPNHKLFSVP